MVFKLPDLPFVLLHYRPCDPIRRKKEIIKNILNIKIPAFVAVSHLDGRGVRIGPFSVALPKPLSGS